MLLTGRSSDLDSIPAKLRFSGSPSFQQASAAAELVEPRGVVVAQVGLEAPDAAVAELVAPLARPEAREQAELQARDAAAAVAESDEPPVRVVVPLSDLLVRAAEIVARAGLEAPDAAVPDSAVLVAVIAVGRDAILASYAPEALL